MIGVGIGCNIAESNGVIGGALDLAA